MTFTVDAYPGMQFQGQVAQMRLNATMTQSVVTYTVVVDTDNSHGKLKPYLKDGDRLALLLPGDNGSLADMLSGVLTDVAPRRRLTLLRRQTGDAAALDEAAEQGYSLALISCTSAGSAVLFEHGADGWHWLAAWPYPAEARRQRWQRILAWPPLCRR